MLKNSKLLIILTSSMSLVLIALLVNTKIIRVREGANEQIVIETKPVIEKKVLSPEDIKNLKLKYDQELLAVTNEYDRIINLEPESGKKEELEKLRERMLDLVIPEEYKKTHLELVLIFTKINDILNEEKKDIDEAEILLARVKEKYKTLEKT
ncbi:MAG: hypothetical protein US83_C0001G0082 [Candidatus Falkowbacteria bacterium GW2011_GWC2_38_22]|uniref:Uncharacterized protein n=1 Tax=Candidatus Falkowbacteria bacterium GW2011_GWE1_38_31 TaxID=1618638 RepID=A0A0G0JU14_9BACT|nr:MAG: hypothetical protein US73_C0004G0046 [Candidatus Falkowbacteria bacterium GW2011_GWF2_38_1205]KKQ62148.1 MAG: hypothetical protein US83_C0001G0082 [Candidatus Falkowbacteria bacterium GW2011_GWC2_38_22]KKQ64298.1 MAG: hypothetical protein US84_C0001G0082 [Candidatus Falkowbacteria bacterium GW2011_GWF1_38_22]KKQ66275.1 MAG: hypothetical protein US87_C0002G0082 [Candidatus Falkowbacteria bacterium GW2011_GWE2_38_254]KKQ71003.1 MAG: hypothetical protein US91_C0002G0082 [Candidatus Falkowb